MFGSFGTFNTPTLFGGVNQTQNMFNTQPTMTGTPNKFNPLNSTDTVQKENNNTTIQTKIYSISAMPEYESKTFEELRWEDYQANRKTGNLSMFGGGSSGGFGTTNAFSSFNNQSSQQQNQNTYGGGNLFNNTQQTQLNTSFGTNLNKAPLFGTNTTSTGFGGLNNTTKSTMFGNPTTQVANKPLFGATNTNSSLFGENTDKKSCDFKNNQCYVPQNVDKLPNVYDDEEYNDTNSSRCDHENRTIMCANCIFPNSNAIVSCYKFHVPKFDPKFVYVWLRQIDAQFNIIQLSDDVKFNFLLANLPESLVEFVDLVHVYTYKQLQREILRSAFAMNLKN